MRPVLGCNDPANKPARVVPQRHDVPRIERHRRRRAGIGGENLGDALNYLDDGMPVEVVFYDGKAISVEMPTTVIREVEYTEPAVRGDTSGKVMKPARIKPTGFELPVAAFVEIGDMIEIDTRTNEFKRRAN